MLDMDEDEVVSAYPTQSSGIMHISKQILNTRQHNQIIFHKLSDDATLCEIKPFVVNENMRQYVIKGGSLKVIENLDAIYLYFNGVYYGCIKQNCFNIKFEKFEKGGQEFGLLYLSGDNKYLILFNSKQVLFCGQYIDSEILKDYVQVYTHVPNMFNVGNLIKYDFVKNELQIKSVSDRGEEHKQTNSNFNIIYFLEAIKCGRYKYAYNKLSYELKSNIDIATLGKYFAPFDDYVYIYEQDVYITLKNNKVAGVYHFGVKDNMIDNIY